VLREDATVCLTWDVNPSIFRVRVGNYQRALIRSSSNEPKFNVFLALTEQNVWSLFYSLGCVAGVYMNFEEFFIPRLEVEGSSDMLF
jgi:hypothetical protein